MDGREGRPAGEMKPGHDHAGDPEEEDVVAGDENVRRVEVLVVGGRSGHPRTEKGQSWRRTRCRARRGPARGASSRRSRRTPGSPPRPSRGRWRRRRPGSGGPTRAAGRCTSRGCCASSRSRSSPGLGDEAHRPLLDGADRRLARGATFTNHWFERYGSMTVSQRWQWPRLYPCSSLATRRSSATAARGPLARFEPVEAGVLPGLGVISPSGPMTTIAGRPCRFAIAKSLASCAGVTFTMPVPNSRSTRIGSSMIGSSRPTIGRIAAPPEGRRARVVRMDRQRRVAEHRLGAGRRHDGPVGPPGTS